MIKLPKFNSLKAPESHDAWKTIRLPFGMVNFQGRTVKLRSISPSSELTQLPKVRSENEHPDRKCQVSGHCEDAREKCGRFDC